MRLYADRLDSFYGGGASREEVRAKRRKNFTDYYTSTDVQLSGISIDIDASGSKATVLYDNTYNWRGGSKSTAGKSQNQMIMAKRGSQWLITSETHIRYY